MHKPSYRLNSYLCGLESNINSTFFVSLAKCKYIDLLYHLQIASITYEKNKCEVGMSRK